MTDLERYYDLSADDTAREWYPNDILMPTHRDFLALLPGRPRVLDLGCGPGYESARLKLLGAEVLGIDFSSRSIAIARSRNPDCRFLVMDFREIDRGIGMFDGILASGSLIHVPPQSMTDILSSIRELLLPGGVLAALVRDGDGTMQRQRVVHGETFGWVAHLYTEEAFTQYCLSSGLSFLRPGVLDKALVVMGWRCYLAVRR